MPAEAGIQRVVESEDLGATIFLEQRVEVPATGPVHQFDGDLELGLLDDGEVDVFAELLEVGRGRVDLLAAKRADQSGLEGPARFLTVADMAFDAAGDFGRSGRSVGPAEFEALVFGRVVAGGHVDAAQGLAHSNRVGDDRGRCVALAEQGSQPIGGQHLSHGQ